MSTLKRPVDIIAGTAVALGGAFSFGPRPLRSAGVAGAIAVALLGSSAVSIWRLRQDKSLVQRAVPWVVIGLFGLLSAGLIAIGRVGFGYRALLESRYVSLTVWTYIGGLMLACVLRDNLRTMRANVFWAGTCATLALLYAISLPSHLARIQEAHRERLQSLAVYTFAEAASGGAPMIPPWLDWPATRVLLLTVERGGWRRRRPAAPTWISAADSSGRCDFGEAEILANMGPRVIAGGWAALPTRQRAADAVLVTDGRSRRIVAIETPSIGRGDVGQRLRADAALVSGWVVDSLSLPLDTPLQFWALDIESLRAYELCAAANAGEATPTAHR
jgi:hypothetical protein